MGLLLNAQSVINTLTIPPFGVSQAVTPPGTKIVTTITNKGTGTSTIAALYRTPGMEIIFNYHSAMLDWLLAQAPSPIIEEKRMQLMKAALHLVKSPRHQNTLLITDEWSQNKAMDSRLVDSVHVRNHDAIGSFTLFHTQCYDMCQDVIELLVMTGYFTYDDFRNVSIPGHSCFEWLYYGYWTFTDADANQPGYMFLNPNSPNGFASTNDLCNNHELITAKQFYRYFDELNGDSMNLCPWVTLGDYQSHFTSPTIFPLPFHNRSYMRTGVWKISKNATITFDSHYTTTVYLLDTVNPVGAEVKAKMEGWVARYKLNHKDTSAIDSILTRFAGLLSVSKDSAINILSAKAYKWINRYTWTPPVIDYRQIVPTFHLSIPPVSRDLVIGADVSFDLWVTDIKVGGGTIDLNGNIIADSMKYPLWGEPGDVVAPGLPKEMINCFNSGTIPAGTSVEVNLAWNPIITNPFTGFMLNQLSVLDTLCVNGIVFPTSAMKQSK